MFQYRVHINCVCGDPSGLRVMMEEEMILGLCL